MKIAHFKTTAETNDKGFIRLVNQRAVSEFMNQFPDSTFEISISLMPSGDIPKLIRTYHALVLNPVKLYLSQLGQSESDLGVDLILTARNPLCWETVHLPNGTPRQRLKDKYKEFNREDWIGHINFCQIFCSTELGITLTF